MIPKQRPEGAPQSAYARVPRRGASPFRFGDVPRGPKDRLRGRRSPRGARTKRSAQAPGPVRPWFERIQTFTGIVTGIAALTLSIMNWIQLNHRPSVTMTMPSLIRISQGTDYANVYLQPTFTVAEKTDLTGIVSWVRLEVEPLAGSAAPPAPRLFWEETVDFVYNAQSGEADYRYLSDPAPIVVTQDKPQLPYILFESDRPFGAGDWQWRVIAERQHQTPLVAEMCVHLSTEDVTQLKEQGLARYLVFRAIRSTSSASACYRRNTV